MSALLAVIGAVSEFGRTVTAPLGAPAGEVDTFVEVPFPGVDKNVADGLIQIRYGQHTWIALVQVKTGNGRLDVARLESYLDVAREQRFDAVLTISNEIPPSGQHPVGIGHRRPPTVVLYHYTWSHLLAEAVMLKDYRGVADLDQAWVLGELIQYLEHPGSGTLHPIGLEVIDLTSRPELRESETRTMERGTMERGTMETATIVSTTSVSRSVSVEPAKPAPKLPSRRELRLARMLDTGAGTHPSAVPEAGWYQDPGDERRLRWYDGTAWSERTYPALAALA